jgi:hypothetical protein
VELHTVEWIPSCFPNCNKLFIVRRCCLSGHFPKITEFLGTVVGAHHDGFLMVVICNTLTGCKFANEPLRHLVEYVTFVACDKLDSVDNRLLPSDW